MHRRPIKNVWHGIVSFVQGLEHKTLFYPETASKILVTILNRRFCIWLRFYTMRQ